MSAAAVEGILETALYARDLDAAGHFYHDILGLDIITRAKDRHVFFRCGAAGVLLVFNADETLKPAAPGALPVPAHGTTGAGHACFRLAREKFDGVIARLTAASIAIEADFEWPMGGRSIYFRDQPATASNVPSPHLGNRIGLLDMRKLDTRTIVVASHNAGKIREIADLIGPFGFRQNRRPT